MLNEAGAAITANAPASIQRYIPAMGYHYFTTAVNGATLAQINNTVPLVNLYGQYFDPINYVPANSLSNIWKMDETHSNPNNPTDQAAWKAPTGLEMMQNMRGYALIFPYAGANLQLSGTENNLNNGNISYNLTHGGNGFNFIGNPYPSPMDWNAVANSLPKQVGNTIFFFYPTSYYYGTWGYYNPDSRRLRYLSLKSVYTFYAGILCSHRFCPDSYFH